MTAVRGARLAVRQRVRERQFWVIQAGVAAVTMAHLVVEANGLQGLHELGGLGYAPLVLHAAPVAYAGLVYGLEGSVLTGLWTSLLALPNLVVWHADDYSWLADLAFLAFVLVLGGVVAVPVERERVQRRRAEAAQGRLATLFDVASRLAAGTDVHGDLESVLGDLTERLGLRGAAVEIEQPHRQVVVSVGRSSDGQPLTLPRNAGPPTVLRIARERPLTDDEESLLTTIGSHLAVVLDRAWLHDQERARLTSYVHEVTRAQERERARIARDLHDVVAQDLVALSRQLDADGRDADGAARARDALDAVRRYSRDLRPTVLDDLGIVPALGWLADEAQMDSDVQVRVSVTGTDTRLVPETELALFRIAQEALRNAVRHGGASSVAIELDLTTTPIRLAVHDDGRGFVVPDPLDAMVHVGRLGLLGMRERADLVGGDLTVESSPSHGCTVTVEVPDEATTSASTS